MRLKGKTALIAGAGRNSGKAIALAFAREGADLILIAKQHADELDRVSKECQNLGARTLPLQIDISKHEEVNRAVESGLEHFGNIDILVCVAAIRPHKPLWHYTYEEWHQVFGVNLHSAFYLAKAVIPHMIERRTGSIIALGSIVSFGAQVNSAVEVTCKHGLFGFVKSLALELGPYGIRANMVALGSIENEWRNPEWFPAGNPDTPERISTLPLQRTGTPDEVAKVALFLASDDSSFVTGDRILCTGGLDRPRIAPRPRP